MATPLTDKVIATARAEIGYREGKTNGHWNNKTKYGPAVPGLEWADWQAWCGTFVSWVAMTAGAAELFPRTASCAAGVKWFRDRKRFSEYPAVGAQVFYGTGEAATRASSSATPQTRLRPSRATRTRTARPRVTGCT